MATFCFCTDILDNKGQLDNSTGMALKQMIILLQAAKGTLAQRGFNQEQQERFLTLFNQTQTFAMSVLHAVLWNRLANLLTFAQGSLTQTNLNDYVSSVIDAVKVTVKEVAKVHIDHMYSVINGWNAKYSWL